MGGKHAGKRSRSLDQEPKDLRGSKARRSQQSKRSGDLKRSAEQGTKERGPSPQEEDREKAVVQAMNDIAPNKELTLRTYQLKDLPRMLDIIMEYVPQLPNYATIKCDRSRVEYVLRHNIDNAAAFCCWVVCDTHDEVQGGAAGWCVMSLLSKDLVADDVFMFVLPEYRTLRNANMLLVAYKEWAQARGAKLIRASHTGGSFRPGTKEYDLFNALLTRQGFKPVGTIYHLEPEN